MRKPDGERVKYERNRLALSQEALRKRAGIGLTSLYKIEKGSPVDHTIMQKLAECLNVDVEVLYVDGSPSDEDAIRVLPPKPPLFVGRKDDLHAVNELLGRFDVGYVDQACVVVRGSPGIGKTTLSARIALEANWPIVLWTSLGKSPDVIQKLKGWVEAVGGNPAASDRSDELRRIVGERRALLIIDDVWDTNHALPFIVGGPKTTYLFTTRSSKIANDLSPQGDVHYLQGMSLEDSLDLVRAIAPEAEKEHRQAVRALLKDLEGHPLAITVVSKMLAIEHGRKGDIPALIQEVQESASRLMKQDTPIGVQQIIDHCTTTVFAVFQKSTDLLSERDRKRFSLLGILPSKPAVFDGDSIQAAWNLDERSDWKETVDTLLDLGLLEVISENQYQMHSLLSMYSIFLAGLNPDEYLI